jgi:uncharacterized membrane protein (UPF0127 family)
MGFNVVGSKVVKSITLCALALSTAAIAAESKTPVAQIGNNKIKLEVASTPEQIQRGLMYRTSMPEDNGMVFIFHPSHGVKFWMAHCFINLDMLMIKDGKIVKIFENVPPCKAADERECPTYPAANEPAIDVSEVVEVNGGYAKRHGIKEGDTVKFFMNGDPGAEEKKSKSK